MSPSRRQKLCEMPEALGAVSPGTFLAVGGLWFHNTPSAALREIIRSRVGQLTLITAPPSSLGSDLLIAAGAVARAYLAHVSFEHLGLAPNFRRATESGELDLVECDEATLLGGLMATLEGIPEHPIVSLKGTDHLGRSPLARPYETSGGEAVVVSPAIKPDVAIIHAQEADAYGNVRCFGTPFCDPLFAKAASHVIVTADRIVPNETVRSEPHRTTIPGYLVDAVVAAPFGAHPCSSHGMYAHDEDHLREYIAASSGGPPTSYLGRYVFGTAGQTEYLQAVGGPAHIGTLGETP